MDTEHLLTLRAAGTRLRVSQHTLRALLREWRIPIYPNPLSKREKLVDWRDLQRAHDARLVPTNGTGETP